MDPESSDRPSLLPKILTILCLCLYLIFLPYSGYSVTRVASNGNWANASTWTPSGVPANNDSLIIPLGVSVTLSTNEGSSTFNLRVNIRGTLVFDNGKLHVSATSLFYLQPTGSFSCAGGCGNNDQLRIGGSSNKVWQGDVCGPINGPGVVNSSFNCAFGPAPLPLPVVFLHPRFSSNQDQQIKISWPFVSDGSESRLQLLNSKDGFNYQVIETKVFRLPNGRTAEFEIELPHSNYGSYWKLTQLTVSQAVHESSVVHFLVKSDDEVQMYPSITSQEFKVSCKGEQIDAYIYSMKGELMLQVTITQDQIVDVSNLQAGHYLVKLIIDQSQSVKHLQVVR